MSSLSEPTVHALARVAVLAALAVAAAASAQPPPGDAIGPGKGPGGGAGPCAADVPRLCPSEPRGPGRMRCLQQHESELSPECRKEMAAYDVRLIKEPQALWHEA